MKATPKNLLVLTRLEEQMQAPSGVGCGLDRIDGHPALTSQDLRPGERYHAERLIQLGFLKKTCSCAPWHSRRPVTLYYVDESCKPNLLAGSVTEATSTRKHAAASRSAAPAIPVPVRGRLYQQALFSGVPLYTTRLVRERVFTFPEREQVSSPSAAASVLQDYFEDRDREEFIVCFLDTASTLVGLHVASVGGLAASIVEPRQVFKAAVLANAASLLLAHNHPSGNPEPSREDVEITKRLVETGKLMGIPVHDHLIIAGRGYTSLAERGLM